MPVTATARAETVPPSHRDRAPDRETRDLTATGDTYEAAVAEIRALVPEGWRLMHLTVER